MLWGVERSGGDHILAPRNGKIVAVVFPPLELADQPNKNSREAPCWEELLLITLLPMSAHPFPADQASRSGRRPEPIAPESRTSTNQHRAAVRFINVDLDLESRKSLDYLYLELSSSEIHHLHCGPSERGFFARLECANGGETCEPDSVINRFCEALESLDERAQDEWSAAHHRIFDIGYEVADSTVRWHSELRSATFIRVTALGAAIGFTVYPNGNEPL